MTRAHLILLEELIDSHARIDAEPDMEMLNSAAVVEASEAIAAIYAKLLTSGMSEEAVGRAMIGATIALYDAMDLGNILPAVLRRVASNIEARGATSH